jgi:hypothetical protein
MTSEDTDITAEYIDKDITADYIDKLLRDNDYFPKENNPVLTTANMMEEFLLLEDKEPQQIEKDPKTSVGRLDPVLYEQNVENFSLGGKIEKEAKISFGRSNPVSNEQIFDNGLSDQNGSPPGNGLISALTSPLAPESLSPHVPHLELIFAMTTSTDFPMSSNAEPTLPHTRPHPIDTLRAARALSRTN